MIKFTTPEDRVIKGYAQPSHEGFTEVTENERALLNLLVENLKYTAVVLAAKLSVSRQTVSKRIKALKDKGIIERQGSDTRGFWMVKIDKA